MRNHRDEYKKNRKPYAPENEFQLRADVDAVQGQVTEMDADVESMKAELTLLKKLVKATVTFNSNGGSDVASQSIAFGEAATEPEDPTKTDYTFGGWFTEDALTNEYDFDTPVVADITLYAKWVAAE